MKRKLCAPWIGVWLAALATPTTAMTLGELAEAVDAPRVGAAVELAGPLAVGRARFEVPAGGARVLLAGDRPCGLVLLGGRLRYTIDDPQAIPVARRNAGELGVDLSTGDTAVVDVALEEAVIWGWDLAPATAEAAPAAAGALPEWVARVLEHPLFLPPSIPLLAADRGLAPGARVALLRAGSKRLLYQLDPSDDRLEVLSVLDTLDSRYEIYKGRVLPYELVTQPVSRRAWEERPAALVSEHLQVMVDNPGGRQVDVTSTTRLRATRGGASVWLASLRDSVVEEARREYPVSVRAVRVGGQPVDFLHRASTLAVALPAPLAAGQTVEVTVESGGEIALRPNNDSYWSLGTWSWYPQPALNGELATLDLTVRVPDPFRPFASGDTVSEVNKDGFTTLVTRSETPLRYPVVAAGKYTVVEETRNGRTCRVAAYAFGKEKESRRLIGNLFSTIEYFETLLATPYPYRELEIVEINDWGFGQAPPGVIFITQEAFNPLASEINQFFSTGVNGRLIHEIAHGWFGGRTKWGSLDEQWLSESFAQYAAALALEAANGGAKSRDGRRAFEKELRLWKGAADFFRQGSVFFANHLAGKSDNDWERRMYLLYNKGPFVLHALRQELTNKLGPEQGDKVFIVWLRAYLKNFDHTWGATRHLVGILDQITKQSWQPWFERYVYGTEMPEVKMP